MAEPLRPTAAVLRHLEALRTRELPRTTQSTAPILTQTPRLLLQSLAAVLSEAPLAVCTPQELEDFLLFCWYSQNVFLEETAAGRAVLQRQGARLHTGEDPNWLFSDWTPETVARTLVAQGRLHLFDLHGLTAGRKDEDQSRRAAGKLGMGEVIRILLQLRDRNPGAEGASDLSFPGQVRSRLTRALQLFSDLINETQDLPIHTWLQKLKQGSLGMPEELASSPEAQQLGNLLEDVHLLARAEHRRRRQIDLAQTIPAPAYLRVYEPENARKVIAYLARAATLLGKDGIAEALTLLAAFPFAVEALPEVTATEDQTLLQVGPYRLPVRVQEVSGLQPEEVSRIASALQFQVGGLPVEVSRCVPAIHGVTEEGGVLISRAVDEDRSSGRLTLRELLDTSRHGHRRIIWRRRLGMALSAVASVKFVQEFAEEEFGRGGAVLGHGQVDLDAFLLDNHGNLSLADFGDLFRGESRLQDPSEEVMALGQVLFGIFTDRLPETETPESEIPADNEILSHPRLIRVLGGLLDGTETLDRALAALTAALRVSPEELPFQSLEEGAVYTNTFQRKAMRLDFSDVTSGPLFDAVSQFAQEWSGFPRLSGSTPVTAPAGRRWQEKTCPEYFRLRDPQWWAVQTRFRWFRSLEAARSLPRTSGGQEAAAAAEGEEEVLGRVAEELSELQHRYTRQWYTVLSGGEEDLQNVIVVGDALLYELGAEFDPESGGPALTLESLLTRMLRYLLGVAKGGKRVAHLVFFDALAPLWTTRTGEETQAQVEWKDLCGEARQVWLRWFPSGEQAGVERIHVRSFANWWSVDWQDAVTRLRPVYVGTSIPDSAEHSLQTALEDSRAFPHFHSLVLYLSSRSIRCARLEELQHTQQRATGLALVLWPPAQIEVSAAIRRWTAPGVLRRLFPASPATDAEASAAAVREVSLEEVLAAATRKPQPQQEDGGAAGPSFVSPMLQPLARYRMGRLLDLDIPLPETGNTDSAEESAGLGGGEDGEEDEDSESDLGSWEDELSDDDDDDLEDDWMTAADKLEEEEEAAAEAAAAREAAAEEAVAEEEAEKTPEEKEAEALLAQLAAEDPSLPNHLSSFHAGQLVPDDPRAMLNWDNRAEDDEPEEVPSSAVVESPAGSPSGGEQDEPSSEAESSDDDDEALAEAEKSPRTGSPAEVSDVRKELDAALLESEELEGPAAKSVHLWAVLSSLLARLPKQPQSFASTIPAFQKLFNWLQQPEANRSTQARQRVKEVLQFVKAHRDVFPPHPAFRRAYLRTLKVLKSLQAEQARTLFYDNLQRQMSSVKAPRVVLRDIVVHSASRKDGDGEEESDIFDEERLLEEPLNERGVTMMSIIRDMLLPKNKKKLPGLAKQHQKIFEAFCLRQFPVESYTPDRRALLLFTLLKIYFARLEPADRQKFGTPMCETLLDWALAGEKAPDGIRTIAVVTQFLKVVYQPISKRGGRGKAGKGDSDKGSPGRRARKQLQPPVFPQGSSLQRTFKSAVVIADIYQRGLERHKETVEAAINQAKQFGRGERRIQALDDSLVSSSVQFAKNGCPEVAVPGVLQLLDWSLTQFRRLAQQYEDEHGHLPFRAAVPEEEGSGWSSSSSAGSKRGRKKPTSSSSPIAAAAAAAAGEASEVSLTEQVNQAAVRVYQIATDAFRRYRRFLSAEAMTTVLESLFTLELRGLRTAARVMAEAWAFDRNIEDGTDENSAQDVLTRDPSEDPVDHAQMSFSEFQLQHAGHLLIRDVQSRPDKRVSFYPDGWQVDLLDTVDDGLSALVVAPTASGKTFISYYAIGGVLRANRERQQQQEQQQEQQQHQLQSASGSSGVSAADAQDAEEAKRSTKFHRVVYVAPTDALINQVAGEIYHRYGAVVGSWTQNTSHNALTSQVLVTSPQLMERILLDPRYASFVRSVKYVILDEVHFIGMGTDEDGSVWERVLALLPCPFLALSATLANTTELVQWLNTVHGDKMGAWRTRRAQELAQTRWEKQLAQQAAEAAAAAAEASSGRGRQQGKQGKPSGKPGSQGGKKRWNPPAGGRKGGKKLGRRQLELLRMQEAAKARAEEEEAKAKAEAEAAASAAEKEKAAEEVSGEASPGGEASETAAAEEGKDSEEKKKKEVPAELVQEELGKLRERQWVQLISHGERWSSLDKFMYFPNNPTPASRLIPVHPLHALRQQRGSLLNVESGGSAIPDTEEMEMSPRENLQLYLAMEQVADHAAALAEEKAIGGEEEDQDGGGRNAAERQTAVHALAPGEFFKELPFITRNDVTRWSRALREELASWVQAQSREADSVMDVLAASLNKRLLEEQQLSGGAELESGAGRRQQLLDSIVTLLYTLRDQAYLPALLFAFDRSLCEELALTTLTTLEEMEKTTREAEFDPEKEAMRQAELKQLQSELAKLESMIRKRNRPDQKQVAQVQKLKSSIYAIQAEQDQSAIDPRFAFGRLDLGDSDFEHWVLRIKTHLRWSDSNPWMRCLIRGIGVHHQGMPQAYRDLVEVGFRSGQLRVVFATETLAYGINMPARTAAFIGDSSTLNSLVYRQCSGRAGRRGYDYMGQVVFFGLPLRKTTSLIVSPLPKLPCLFYLDPTTILRMLASYARAWRGDRPVRSRAWVTAALKTIFSQPPYDPENLTDVGKISEAGEAAVEELRKYLRFSTDSLVVAGHLSTSAGPAGLAGVVASLAQYDQTGSLLLAHLLKRGTIQTICSDFPIMIAGESEQSLDSLTEARERVSRLLLWILSSLFERVPLPAGFRLLEDQRRSPSIVLLPSLPGLSATQKDARDSPQEAALAIGAGTPASIVESIRSSLSAAVSEFQRHQSLVQKQHSVIGPILKPGTRGVFGGGHLLGLNSFALDFFKHGQLQVLVDVNGMSADDAWQRLRNIGGVIHTLHRVLRRLCVKADDPMIAAFAHLKREYVERTRKIQHLG